MPLAVKDKNAIALGLQLLPLVFAPPPAGLGAIPLVLGLTAQLDRVRFPRLSPTDIGRAVQASLRGSVLSGDPFFGDIVISHPDQARHLTELVRESAIRRVAAEQDTSRIFLQRRALAEGLAASAEERGFAATIDPNLRGGVFRPTADAPLQFIEGDFLP